jgi:hypothetical protein
VILDDFSHFLWTFPLRLKSDTFTTLTHFFVWVSTQFHRPVRALQCDNDREFDNRAFRSFFFSHGVQLRLSCPYTSAQNGWAECMIRTTTNMIRCLLFQASLPASYWAEALHTATHLLNRLPSKAVNHPTPYFALYGTAPTYDHLRVFGCTCYPNTSATAPHKLSPRSTCCLFLGYSSDHKGYRCLDLASHRIIISLHVVFDEDVFPLAGPSPPTDLDSLLESDQVSPSSQVPRLAPLPAPRAGSTSWLAPTPAPRAAPSTTPAPRAAPPTPPAPCAAPSTPTICFADPTLVYRRRRHVNTSAPADSGPSMSPVRFADPAVVYHRRELATPAAPDVLADRPEPPVYHPVAIHRVPGHVHPMVTRRAAGVLQPVDRLILAADTTTTPPDASPVPSSVRTALAGPHWRRAMEEEYAALLANHTWDLMPCPPGTNVVTDKWLFRHKLTSDGSLDRYKARWVLRGFTQRPGVDYDETFSPVVKFATVPIVLFLALSRDWAIHQLDVKNAFLHDTLTETVYCSQPTGFVDEARPNLVCRLNRSLYGLKQAPRTWYSRFTSYLASIGFVEAKSDTSLFIYRRGDDDTVFLFLYVDDIVLTTSTANLLQCKIVALQREFAMKDLGPLHHFLGITAERRPQGFFLHQRQYTIDILEWAGMSDCKSCSTPVDTQAKLSEDDGPPVADATSYRSLTGALQYLTFSRPDIAYAVQQVCLHMHNPREPHLTALKRILRYLRSSLDYGLLLRPSPTSELVVYTDTDWAGCTDTRRSTSGYAVFLGTNLVSWAAKRQPIVSRSSAEAEYRAVANGVAEASWLRQLLHELHSPLQRATLVYCDNVSAVYLSTNPVQHQRTKHVEIDLHFVRERVVAGDVRVLSVPTTLQFTDIFTKGLPSSVFLDFRSSLNICTR